MSAENHRVIDGLIIRDDVPSYCCPFCKEPVGWVGRALSWAFGAGTHGCSFTNVMSMNEYAGLLRSRQAPSTGTEP